MDSTADAFGSVIVWRDVRLAEWVDAASGSIRTGPFGSQLHAHEYTDDPFGVPVVMPKDMVGGRVDRTSVGRVNQATAERLKAHRLEPGDLVLARRGDVGRYAFIEDDEAGWLCGTGSMRVHAPDRDVVWPAFLRNAIANPSVTDGWSITQWARPCQISTAQSSLRFRFAFPGCRRSVGSPRFSDHSTSSSRSTAGGSRSSKGSPDRCTASGSCGSGFRGMRRLTRSMPASAGSLPGGTPSG